MDFEKFIMDIGLEKIIFKNFKDFVTFKCMPKFLQKTGKTNHISQFNPMLDLGYSQPIWGITLISLLWPISIMNFAALKNHKNPIFLNYFGFLRKI